MFARSKVVGPRISTSSTSLDPDGPRRGPSQLQIPRQGQEAVAPKDPTGESRGHSGHRSTGAYTLIAPNENQRRRIQRVAEQELADLEKWKQQNRAKPIHLVPRRLGGSQSESEVRQKQQLQLMGSKYQQKLKRDESVRIRKEAEEAALQRMKAIQREKSNKLEEKKRLQENLRKEAIREHRQHKTAEFLSRLDKELPKRSTCHFTPHHPQCSTWNKSLEAKQQQQEEERDKIYQVEHRRVNDAFLDRLQGKNQPGGLEQSAGCWNMNSASSWGN